MSQRQRPSSVRKGMAIFGVSVSAVLTVGIASLVYNPSPVVHATTTNATEASRGDNGWTPDNIDGIWASQQFEASGSPTVSGPAHNTAKNNTNITPTALRNQKPFLFINSDGAGGNSPRFQASGLSTGPRPISRSGYQPTKNLSQYQLNTYDLCNYNSSILDRTTRFGNHGTHNSLQYLGSNIR